MTESATTDNTPFEVPPDATPVAKLAQRDGAAVLAALCLFAAADAWYIATDSAFAALLSLAVGVVVGGAVTRQVHEWGHFTGARFRGGIAPTREISSFFPIFDFDMKRGDPAAFRAMSVGGNVAHWTLVLLLLLLLPLDTPGQIALAASSFGYAVYGSSIELPIIRRAYAGATPIESFAGFSGEVVKRSRWIGIGAGLLLFVIL